MTSRRSILIGGGARSGKSAFALRLGRRLGNRRVYVATAEAGDAEMADRIHRHAKERGSEYRTVEAARNVPEALESIADADVVVLDCVTFWAANLLMAGRTEGDILAETERLVRAVRAAAWSFVGITNEVGMGVVPEAPLGRAFRDVVGRIHQILAASADEIYFGAMGRMLRLKPAPVALVEESE